MNINIDLDEFSDEEVVKYVINRYENKSHFPLNEELKQKLVESVSGVQPISVLFNIECQSVEGQIKIELLQTAFEKYSLVELENKLK